MYVVAFVNHDPKIYDAFTVYSEDEAKNMFGKWARTYRPELTDEEIESSFNDGSITVEYEAVICVAETKNPDSFEDLIKETLDEEELAKQ